MTEYTLDEPHFPIGQFETADFWRVMRALVREEVRNAIKADRSEQAAREWQYANREAARITKLMLERLEEFGE